PLLLYHSFFRPSLHSFPTRRSSDLFSSGMAAISTLFLTLLKAGDHVVLQDQIYGGTYAFVVNLLERAGIGYSFAAPDIASLQARSEEHTSELQSREKLVCRLLLEKK